MNGKRVKLFLGVAGGFGVLGLMGVLSVGSLLTKPANRDIGEHSYSFEVTYEGAGEKECNGWIYWPSERWIRHHSEFGQPRGVVMLLHPLRGDRTDMTDRAWFLTEAGYVVFTFDLQAHGENPGERITMGHLESQDALAALQFLKRRFKSEGFKIAALGVSLGGAACLLGERPLDADALVLEAVYTTVDKAVENRLAIRMGGLAKVLSPLLLWQIEPRLGVSRSQLRPVDAVSLVSCPLLVISGSKDQRTTPSDSRALAKAAPRGSQHWEIKGARHVDFHSFAGMEYENRILEFLEEALHGKGNDG